MNRFFLLLLYLVWTGAAHAQSVQTAYAGGTPVTLTIPVTASIGGRCGFADGALPAGTFNKDNFDVDGFAAEFDFSLNCSGPSRVAISSSNGGLLANTAAPTGYGNRSDYDVTLNLVANDGSKVQASCAASSLQSGGPCAFAGTASVTHGLQLAAAAVNQSGSYLKIAAPARAAGNPVLVQGSYADVLTVTVSAAL